MHLVKNIDHLISCSLCFLVTRREKLKQLACHPLTFFRSCLSLEQVRKKKAGDLPSLVSLSIRPPVKWINGICLGEEALSHKCP